MNKIVEPIQSRCIFLGASNLTRGIATVVRLARQTCSGPIDAVFASGHGRSFGWESRVLGRTLPPIITCGLWDAISTRPELPTYALITDIGNDLLYGASVEQIVDWVETCAARLASISRCLVITQLPLESVHHLSPSRFLLMRSLMFPRSRLSLEQANRDTAEINLRLARIAARHNAVIMSQQYEWFGIDPIHVRMRYWNDAWGRFLSPWTDIRESATSRSPLMDWCRLRYQRPLMRRLFGFTQTRAQPCLILRDGTRVSLF